MARHTKEIMSLDHIELYRKKNYGIWVIRKKDLSVMKVPARDVMFGRDDVTYYGELLVGGCFYRWEGAKAEADRRKQHD